MNLSEYVVKRLFINKRMVQDRFDILLHGDLVANVGYARAHDFMLGKLPPGELINGHTDAGVYQDTSRASRADSLHHQASN